MVFCTYRFIYNRNANYITSENWFSLGVCLVQVLEVGKFLQLVSSTALSELQMPDGIAAGTFGRWGEFRTDEFDMFCFVRIY